MKLRAVISVEYEADPVHYGTSDPYAMAEIDEETAAMNPSTVLDFGIPVVRVQPVEDEAVIA